MAKSKLQTILHYFPETTLPIVVSEDYLADYEAQSDPFPESFIHTFIAEWEGEIDDYTEFIPCFRLPPEEKFRSIVYWRGGLLKYEFILVTLDPNGEKISKKIIANTIVDGPLIKKSVAGIEPDLIINIIAGQTLDGEDFEAGNSQAFTMEILPSGEIIFMLDSMDMD